MRRPTAAAVLVFATIAGIYVLAFVRSPMEPIQGDGFYTFLWARSLAFDGDLDLENDLALCGDPWGLAVPHRAGLGPRNQWNPGPAIGWTPMLWVGRFLRLGERMSPPELAGCRGPIAEIGVFGSVLMALLALLLAYRLARRYVSEGPALMAVAGVALASPLPYYACYLPSYGHAASAFAVALFFERWDATRGVQSERRWILLGALLGIAMLVRPQNAVLVVAPLAEWVGVFRRELRMPQARRLLRTVGVGVGFTVAALVVFSPQLHIWKSSYGTWIAMPQGPHFMRWGEPSVDGVLFGSTGGLLVWTPLLWLSFIGLLVGLFRRRMRYTALCMAFVLAATTYINAAVWDYWASMGFSNRRFTGLAVLFVFGMAVVVEGLFRWAERRPRQVAGASMLAVIALAAGWNFAAMRGVGNFRIKSWREAPWEDFWDQIFAELSASVHGAVGNPFAWPASLPFAAHWDTHPSRYDAMRGMSILYAEIDSRRPRAGEETAEFTSRLHSQYLIEGFGKEPERVRGRQAVVMQGYARMLIPFFIEDFDDIEVRWTIKAPTPAPEALVQEAVPSKAGKGKGKGKPEGARAAVRPEPPKRSRVILSWNRTIVGQMEVRDRWVTTRIALPEVVVRAGVNELTWSVIGPPVAIEWLKAVPRRATPLGAPVGSVPGAPVAEPSAE